MSDAVFVRLSTGLRLAIDASFPFSDLPLLLKSLSPARIDVRFRRCCDQPSAVDLALTFDDEKAVDSIACFKEVLIRSEADLDFDCLLLGDKPPLPEGKGDVCVEIEPDVLALPSGKNIAIAMSLLDVAPKVLRQAELQNSELAYGVTLERTEADPISARQLVPALAELQGRQSLAALEEGVRSAFDLLRLGGWSAQERICIPQERAQLDRPWVESLIRETLKSSTGFLTEELWSLRWDRDPSRPSDAVLQQKVARLRTNDFLDQLFTRIVPSDLSRAVISRSLAEARRRGEASVGDYAFVSYAHRNADFVNALLSALERARVRCWRDTSLNAGTRWDEELEDKIRNAGVLIACVSDDYQESKYCKRELKFADLMNKAIVPIAPAKWTWGRGLQMLFQELQVASFDGGRGFQDFCRALESVAPQIFQHRP